MTPSTRSLLRLPLTLALVACSGAALVAADDDQSPVTFRLTLSTAGGACHDPAKFGRPACRNFTAAEAAAFPSWVIKDLRAVNRDGKPGPTGCSGEEFNPTRLEKTLEKLNYNWQPLTAESNEAAWRAAYNDFGKCVNAHSNGTRLTEVDYFRMALLALGNFNASTDLYRANLTENNEKPQELAAFKKALDQTLGGSYRLICDKNAFKKQDVLRDIVVCVNDDASRHDTGCFDNQTECSTPNIWYLQPKSAASRLSAVSALVGLLALVVCAFR